MDKLELKETKNTPHVVFDPASNFFSISGKSFPENAKKFYEPLYKWVDLNYLNFPKEVHFSFELYYISSSSLIAMLDLLRKLDKLSQKGISITVSWTYDSDDDDMRKIGEDYSKILNIPIVIIQN